MALYSMLVQPLVYALAIRQIEFRWIVLTKTKQPSVTCHTAKPDSTAVRRVLGTVQQVWRAIGNHCFYPAPSAMNCAGCGYVKACRQWES